MQEGESHTGSALLSIKELFEKHLPYYMAIGMSYDDYWNGDATLTRVYQKIHRLHQQEKNHELWLQGMYIYEALCKVAPIFRSFAKKGTKPAPYSSAPYPLSMNEAEDRKRKEERLKYQTKQQKVLTWMKRVNKSMKEEGDK